MNNKYPSPRATPLPTFVSGVFKNDTVVDMTIIPMPPTMDISVIIVGGGPVGLTAAHAFSKLGIDFTLLERRDIIAEDVGASIVLWPHGIRIMAQLGLLDQLLSIGTGLMSGTFQTVNGKAFLRTSSPQLCKTK